VGPVGQMSTRVGSAEGLGGGLNPRNPVHVNRRSFLSKNRL